MKLSCSRAFVRGGLSSLLLAVSAASLHAQGGAPAPPAAQDITAGLSVLREVHRRYSTTRFRTLTFTQRTTYPDGRVEWWYEAESVPGKARVDVAPFANRNAQIYRNDSAYVFRNGELTQRSAMLAATMWTLMDMYWVPPEETATALGRRGFDLSKVHEREYNGRPVIVVGALEGDTTSAQFWLDKENLYTVRMTTTRGGKRVTEIGKHVFMGGGWVEQEIRAYATNGQLNLLEEYFDVKVDVELPTNLFEPDLYRTPPWQETRPPTPSPSAESQATPRTEPLSERERAIHLLNRATYGVRPQDVDEVLRVGARRWIELQLGPELIAPLPEADSALYHIEPVSRDQTPQPPRRYAVLEGATVRAGSRLLANKLVRAVTSERQLEQVMTDFWFNHFSVTSGKSPVGRWLPDYEETIRSHVFGRFQDLLIATAQHPAMLVYLDNHLSAASPEYLRAFGIAAPPDRPEINENYARELLELHTVGVGAGYSQRDVVDAARALSGWTLSGYPSPPNKPDEGYTLLPAATSARVLTALSGSGLIDQQLTFRFGWELHDSGPKTVMGFALPGQGIEDGLELLAFLSRHPSTARRVAFKLAQHFVADDPPAALVDELARVFLSTDGDLRQVTLALFTSEAFYAPEHYQAKVKRPFEFVVSALRATDTRLGRASTLLLGSELAKMGQRPYTAPEPTGFPTTAAEWLSERAVLERIEFARDLSEDFGERNAGYASVFRLNDSFDTTPAEIHVDPLAALHADERVQLPSAAVVAQRVSDHVFPGVDQPELVRAVANDLAGLSTNTPEEVLRRALALAIGSPAFQRH